jgi:hypothetical protein
MKLLIIHKQFFPSIPLKFVPVSIFVLGTHSLCSFLRAKYQVSHPHNKSGTVVCYIKTVRQKYYELNGAIHSLNLSALNIS